jgi:geranylgeranyl diphosphate synthase type I
LRDYHETKHLAGNSQHFGESIAINSFLIAVHYAMNILASLSVEPEVRIKAIQNVNKCFIATAHGQTLDIFNEVVAKVSEQDVLNVLEWKTAYYTFVNPLQLGAILAGAKDSELQALAEYGIHAGRTFQITDDILGIFSTVSESGKSPLDDIKEGKRTLMAVYALDNATKPDAYFLEHALGNQNLTMAEFEHCKRILIESGALDYARTMATTSANAAAEVIVKNTNWPQNTKQFLLDLVQYLVDRKS